MCDPLTIALATTAISAGGAQVSAQQQADAAGEAYDANAKAAVEGNAITQSQINEQEVQDQMDLAQAKIEGDLENQRLLSRTKVAGLESGGTLNNQAAIQEVMRQGLVNQDIQTVQLDRSRRQFAQERDTSARTAQSRINSAPKPKVNTAGLAIQAAGAALQGVSTFKSAKADQAIIDKSK
jgi:hypothetical protein